MDGRAGRVAEIVRRANVVYDSTEVQTGHPDVPLLVSNGIIGGCFDHTGFQGAPNYHYPQGRTFRVASSITPCTNRPGKSSFRWPSLKYPILINFSGGES